MKDDRLENIGAITVLISVIFLLVFSPAIVFLLGYLGGMILNWVVGAKLVTGLNLMFNTTRFTKDLIPLSCATLATIGRYFKSSYTKSGNK